MAIPAAIRLLVRQRAGFRCEYCHADERWQFVKFTIDHIVPRSLEGRDDHDNLALACRNCNERRSNRRYNRDSVTGETVPIFNPRQDLWAEHFVWDTDRIRIVGLTPTGRATVALLDINDELHDGSALRVRHRDLLDGYHPPPDDPVVTD
jgi:5-methylcytosine-specific restriction endonuclease McrA